MAINTCVDWAWLPFHALDRRIFITVTNVTDVIVFVISATMVLPEFSFVGR